MQLVTVRFDRVFDIGYSHFPKKRYTYFSFQHGEELHYGVCIPGERRLRQGMVVTACLLKKDDWRTLVAWYDHASGKTASESPAIATVVALMMAWMTANLIRHEIPGHAGAWALFAFSALLSMWSARWLFVLFRVRSAVRSSAAGRRNQDPGPAA